MLVPATLHVPLLDVLLVEPAASEDIECSQEDAFALDSLVEMRIDLDLLVGLDHAAERENEWTERIDVIHVLEPARVGHVEVEWRFNGVQPQEELVHLVRVVGLLKLVERLVHLVVRHSGQLDADLLVDAVLRYLFVLYLSLRSRATEPEKLVNLEAGEAPENQVHGRQKSIVSLEPHQGEYGFTGHVVLRVLLVTIVE